MHFAHKFDAPAILQGKPEAKQAGKFFNFSPLCNSTSSFNKTNEVLMIPHVRTIRILNEVKKKTIISCGGGAEHVIDKVM